MQVNDNYVLRLLNCSISEVAQVIGKTKEELIAYMVKQNKDVDYQNIPENGFNTKAEVDAWWAEKSEAEIYKIYDEYYGVIELIGGM